MGDSERVVEAKKNLREAERLDIEAENAKDREKYGACPRYFNHFDHTSFFVGLWYEHIAYALRRDS